jgi:hypothetical protein
MEEPASPGNARSRLRLGTMASPEECFGTVCRFDSKRCATTIASPASRANEALPTEVFSGAKMEKQNRLQMSQVLSISTH